MYHSRNLTLNWLFGTRIISVEEEAAAEDSVDSGDSEELAQGPESIEVPISKTLGVSRKKIITLSFVSLLE